MHHRNLTLANDAKLISAGVNNNNNTTNASLTSILNSLYYNSANTTHVSTATLNRSASPSSNLHVNQSLSRGLISKQQVSSSSTIKDNRFLADSSRLINILPHTEPKELRLNASVDELLKKFSSESKCFYL